MIEINLTMESLLLMPSSGNFLDLLERLRCFLLIPLIFVLKAPDSAMN